MSPKEQPLVSIITINYNQLAFTCEMLDSIRLSNFKNYEIIVVDNNSDENPLRHLNQNYPEAKVIVSNKNLGFAGGNNLGIKEAKGDYLFFVNNDTEFLKDTITILLELFEAVPSLGVVSPKICFFPSDQKGEDIIQYIGTTPVSPFTARNKTLGRLEKDEGQYQIAETNVLCPRCGNDG